MIHTRLPSPALLLGGLFLTLPALAYGQNLIQNGGFNESGQGIWNIGYPNGHFTSEYAARPAVGANPGYLGDEGTYTIGGNPSQNHQDFRVMTSDQGGDGYMMIVNGSSQPDIVVWRSDAISITPGTLYRFSGYVTNVNANYSWPDWRNTQTIIGAMLSIDGGSSWIDFGILLDLRTVVDPNAWHRFEVTWQNTTGTSVILQVDDFQTAAFGNDFALDTLEFEIIPEPNSAALVGGSAFFLHRHLRLKRRREAPLKAMG